MKKRFRTVSVILIAFVMVSMFAVSCASSKRGTKRTTMENVVTPVESETVVAVS